MPCSVRVLGLGNEILGDDAVGILVARQVAECFPPEEVEVVSSSESGLHLLDYVTDVSRLIVVDSVQTGHAAPGTIHVVHEEDVHSAAGSTPHGTGLFDTLALARTLGFRVPQEVTIIGIETADCLTLGGEMHPAVAAAIPDVVERACATAAGHAYVAPAGSTESMAKRVGNNAILEGPGMPGPLAVARHRSHKQDGNPANLVRGGPTEGRSRHALSDLSAVSAAAR